MVTRLLVVDDSALMRKHLRSIFEEEVGYTVETARNGLDAIEKVVSFEPDVITLDINMPEMDGLTCLEKIMAIRPVPVVMVSSLTHEGAQVTIDALDLGAVGFVEKPGGTVSRNLGAIRSELVSTVRAASRARVRRGSGAGHRLKTVRTDAKARRTRPASQPAAGPSGGKIDGIVLVGVSTGGPPTVEEILRNLPAGLSWPIVIAQHMPVQFTGVFARRLDGLCPMPVVEAERAMPLEPGSVYIAKGGHDVEVDLRLGRLVVRPVEPHPDHAYHPSVDRLVASAMAALPAQQLVGVLLTGMGRDGADQMARLTDAGGRTIAESEETAVVFGMPAALIELGRVSAIEPSDRVARRLLSWIR